MSYSPKSKTFSEMWKLIDSNYEEGDFGSRELLVGIFWEETNTNAIEQNAKDY